MSKPHKKSCLGGQPLGPGDRGCMCPKCTAVTAVTSCTTRLKKKAWWRKDAPYNRVHNKNNKNNNKTKRNETKPHLLKKKNEPQTVGGILKPSTKKKNVVIDFNFSHIKAPTRSIVCFSFRHRVREWPRSFFFFIRMLQYFLSLLLT